MNIRFLNPAEGEMLEAAQFYEDPEPLDSGTDFWTKWRDVWSYCSTDPPTAVDTSEPISNSHTQSAIAGRGLP